MRAHLLLVLFAGVLFSGCKKETEEFQTENLADYLPAVTGKYITYRVDSTIFTNFGANIVLRSYQEKHQVDAQITDGLGRPSFRVFRFIRDEAGSGPWEPSGSYFITPADHSIELVENNLRFLKLATTIQDGNSWKGNRFLPTEPYSMLFEFGNDDAMSDWDYTYSNINEPLTLGGTTYQNTITVEQVIFEPNTNVKSDFQVDNPQLYGAQNFAVDKYAKGIGMVYQEIIMWEYQPPTSPRTGYRGFGIKRSIIDHN